MDGLKLENKIVRNFWRETAFADSHDGRHAQRYEFYDKPIIPCGGKPRLPIHLWGGEKARTIRGIKGRIEGDGWRYRIIFLSPNKREITVIEPRFHPRPVWVYVN